MIGQMQGAVRALPRPGHDPSPPALTTPPRASADAARGAGKFQLSMQPATGHCVHEDAPQAIARVLAEFMARNAVLDIAAIRARTKAALQPKA